MKIDDKMHEAQVEILHALLFKPHAGFTELKKASGLSSDHFNFHLKKMIEQDVVIKNGDGKYVLTIIGKEFANRFDTDERVVERQPKVAVLLIIENDKNEFIFQQRKKQPFYDYWGRPTGKIRFGETVIETAARELMEETGLEADLSVRGVYHKLDYEEESGNLLEDKIFFMVYGSNPRGELKEEFDGGINAWLTIDEVMKQEKVFDGLKDKASVNESEFVFGEHKHQYSSKVY